jgi:hypothetical protein
VISVDQEAFVASEGTGAIARGASNLLPIPDG